MNTFDKNDMLVLKKASKFYAPNNISTDRKLLIHFGQTCAPI